MKPDLIHAEQPNPYQSPDELESPRLQPDERLDYPGGMRLIVFLGLLFGIASTTFLSYGSFGFVVSLTVYPSAFVLVALLLPFQTPELPYRLFGSVLLSAAMSVLFVACLWFAMMILSRVMNRPLALSLAVIFAFVTTLSLGALRIREIARRRPRNLVPTEEDAGSLEANPFGGDSV
ncbi:MAG: hypothetical protein AAFV88_08255 [Planctomycetota bacterium]